MVSKKPIALTLIFLFLTLGACSSTKLAYGFLDWVLNWQVDKYVSLDKTQEATTKRAIDDFHSWHRQTQLLLYADYIKGLKTRLTTGEITADLIHAETDQVQIFLDTSIEKLIPSLVELAASLSDKQTAEIQHNLEKERNEYKEKYIDVSHKKLLSLREKHLKKHLERLLGSLNKAQSIELRKWASSLVPYEELTFKQQLAWAKHAEIALQARDNKIDLENKVRGLMFYHAENWGEEAASVLDKNQDLTYEFIANIFNSMNDKQKAHLERTLDGYVKDFEALAAVK